MTGQFELNHATRGRGEVHTVCPRQRLVTGLIAEYPDRDGFVPRAHVA